MLVFGELELELGPGRGAWPEGQPENYIGRKHVSFTTLSCRGGPVDERWGRRVELSQTVTNFSFRYTQPCTN